MILPVCLYQWLVCGRRGGRVVAGGVMLLKVLSKVLVLKNEKNQINEDNKKMKQAYLARHLISLILK